MDAFYSLLATIISLVFSIVYKFLLPFVLLILIVEIITYMFSGKEGKERVIDKIKATIAGVAIICTVPMLMLGVTAAIGKVTGVDTSEDIKIINNILKHQDSDSMKKAIENKDSTTIEKTVTKPTTQQIKK